LSLSEDTYKTQDEAKMAHREAANENEVMQKKTMHVVKD
jgi:hypothetical protein